MCLSKHEGDEFAHRREEHVDLVGSLCLITPSRIVLTRGQLLSDPVSDLVLICYVLVVVLATHIMNCHGFLSVRLCRFYFT